MVFWLLRIPVARSSDAEPAGNLSTSLRNSSSFVDWDSAVINRMADIVSIPIPILSACGDDRF
jgi:hypothetical protein